MKESQKIFAAIDLLGYRVKDKVTGFEGVVTSVAFDLYGCIQCLVHPGLDDKGEMRELKWFDSNRLDIVSIIKAMDSVFHSKNKGPENKSILPNQI